MQRLYGPETILAEVKFKNSQESMKMKLSDVVVAEKLEKFIEDVKCELNRRQAVQSMLISPTYFLSVFQERNLSVDGVRDQTTTEPVESDDTRERRIGKVSHARTDGR